MKVGVVMPASFGDAADFLANARALDAAGAEFIAVDGNPEEQWMVLGAIGAVTVRLTLLTPSEEQIDVLQRLSRGRARSTLPGGERWVTIPMPPDRASWTAALRDQAEVGVAGVVVPWDERLIDLLRNPGPEDRSDLMMSTG